MSVKFVVQGQNLYRFSKEPILADKSVEFVELEFTFSSEWDGTSKTAQFIQDDKVYSQVLNDNRCYLPQELNEGSFYLSVFGYKGSKRATARKLQMSLEDSGFSQGDVPIPPTPDLYAQLLVKIDEAVAQAEQAVKDAQSAIMNMSVSATSLPSSSEATVDKTVDEQGRVHLNFGIPRGSDGSGGGGSGPSYKIGHGLKLDTPTNTLSVNAVSDFEGDNTLPITAAAVQETVGNIEVLLGTI